MCYHLNVNVCNSTAVSDPSQHWVTDIQVKLKTIKKKGPDDMSRVNLSTVDTRAWVCEIKYSDIMLIDNTLSLF